MEVSVQTAVVVVSEVRFYREALSRALGAEPGLEVVGAVAPGDVLRLVAAHRPQVALLHLGLPAGAGLARAIRTVSAGTRVVALAAAESDEAVLGWAEAGIAGFVAGDGSLGEVAETVRIVAAGGAACPPDVAAALLRRVAATPAVPPPGRTLTARERDVVRLIGQGLTNKEIARALHISLPTVKNHVHNVLDKLQVSRRVDVAGRVGAPV